MTSVSTTIKRVLALVLALIIALAFTACGTSTDTSTDTSSTDSTTVKDPAPGLKFVEYPSISPVFDNEYAKMSEEEKGEYESSLLSAYFNALEDYYPQEHLEINLDDYSSEHNLYYPVEFQEEVRTGYSSDFVIGVDENGYLQVSWLSSVDFASAIVHEESLEEYEDIIIKTHSYWVVHNTLSGELIMYHLTDGEESLGYVPKNSVFVGGSSVWYRLVFQNGSDIWFVELNRRSEPFKACSDVDYVIDTDYDLADDANSEPLFMMKDGTVKAYLYYKDGGSLVDPRDYRDYLIK